MQPEMGESVMNAIGLRRFYFEIDTPGVHLEVLSGFSASPYELIVAVTHILRGLSKDQDWRAKWEDTSCRFLSDRIGEDKAKVLWPRLRDRYLTYNDN
jgi:hypothetical protein